MDVLLHKILCILVLLSAPQSHTEPTFKLHPSLGVVITQGEYEIAYPIKATNPVVECHQVITVGINVTICYNLTEIILGEPSMFKPAWCDDCIWQSMDSFPTTKGDTK